MPRTHLRPGSTKQAALSARRLTSEVARVAVREGPDAPSKLALLIQDATDGFQLPAPVDLSLIAPPALDQLQFEATSQARLLGRRLEKTVRALRQESAARASPAAVTALSNEAIRLLVQSAGWKRVASGASADATGQLLYWLRQAPSAERDQALASMVSGEVGGEAAAPRERAQLSGPEKTALIDMLLSADPQFAGLLREHLLTGGDANGVRNLLIERHAPVEPEPDQKVKETTFDLGTNKVVEKDKVWTYTIQVGQLFDYDVPNVVNGKAELVRSLAFAASNPLTGESGVRQQDVVAFVDQLEIAARSNDPVVSKLLGERIDFAFATTNGGDTPVGTEWELPIRPAADLLAAMSEPATRAHVEAVAKQQLVVEAQRRDALRAPLNDLLVEFNGVPRMHRRAHAALINMGKAGQSARQLGHEETGVLPRSQVVMTPESFSARYADAQNLKLRYLFNDDFELSVISDEDFQRVWDKHGFPPNHELLSYNRPIAGSGYLTVHEGKIVALQDDVEMVPGKLPDRLPAARLVLERQGYQLDGAKIAASSRVLDFEAFLALAKEQPASTENTADVEGLRSKLIDAPHHARPAMVVGILRQRLAEERAANPNGVDAAHRQRTVAYAAKLLSDFRLIEVSIKHFRRGLLPPDKNDFDELLVDDQLADYLVRTLP